MFRAYVRWHRAQLTCRPYLTNAVTSAVLMLAGDRLAQYMERRSAVSAMHSGPGRPVTRAENTAPDTRVALQPMALSGPPDTSHGHVDTTGSSRASWTRTAILTFWSSSVNAPFFTWWYQMLAQRLPGRILLWVATTAIAAAPAINAGFFVFSTTAEHFALHADPWRATHVLRSEVVHRMRTRWSDTVVASAQVWSVVNFFNFTYTPLEYRMLVASVFALAWNVFLSLQQHAADDHSTPRDGPDIMSKHGEHLVAMEEGITDVSVATRAADREDP